MPAEGAVDLLSAEGLDPEAAQVQAELRQKVAAFLETLDPPARRLAALRFVEGLAQEAAATELGLTRSELRTRETHLRRAFAAFLEQHGLAPMGQGGAALAWVLAVLAAEVLRGRP